ncbi:hypothetical protein [Cerasicoccus frondis]|uniref:hypothetical protein n=1 Tax=Cerasicoccus frondis TaxID=490090 RepID=UPI002852BEAC|nr:hypothetical protein [Cerasicoccus frondis]
MKIYVPYADAKVFLGNAFSPDQLHVVTDNDIPMPGDVLISHTEWEDEFRGMISSARARGCKTVLLADGVFEWRNTFEHPPRMSFKHDFQVYHPIHAEYFLAIGEQQAELIQHFNPDTRVMILGAPRLDGLVSHYLETEHVATSDAESLRIFVATALTPGFQQRDSSLALQAIEDLKQVGPELEKVCGRSVEFIWRVSPRIVAETSLTEEEAATGSGDLRALIEQADCVVSTPSTLLLEAMLCRKRAVMIDYTDAPNMPYCAWQIRRPEQLVNCLADALIGNDAKLAMQDYLLSKNLCLEPEASRRLSDILHALPGDDALSMGCAHRRDNPAEPIPMTVAKWEYMLVQEANRMRLRAERLNEKNSLLEEAVERLEQKLQKETARRKKVPIWIRYLCGGES